MSKAIIIQARLNDFDKDFMLMFSRRMATFLSIKSFLKKSMGIAYASGRGDLERELTSPKKNTDFKMGNIIRIKIEGERNQKIISEIPGEVFLISEPEGFNRARDWMTKFELIDAGYEVILLEE